MACDDADEQPKRRAQSSFAAPSGSASLCAKTKEFMDETYEPPTEREMEVHSQRTKLYNAACEYARCVNNPKHTMEEVMRLSDELEATADAWASR